MHIGVLKENKTDERRVALQPCQSQQLVTEGHTVWVEFGAGEGAQYPDHTYKTAGAFLGDKQTILNQCTLLLKVKCPLPEEYQDYRRDHILFTYLHFDENIQPEAINAFIKRGFLGIAYEWVEVNGNYPLLEPMSRLTGHLFFQRSVELLAQHKGLLAGRYLPELPGAKLLIIGVGRIGTEVLKCALLNHVNVLVVARNAQVVHQKAHDILTEAFGPESVFSPPSVIPFNDDDPVACQRQISNIMTDVDILINCAVRRPNLTKSRLPYLINQDMIRQMQPYSIVCDATACDRDLIETCVSSEILTHHDSIDNIIHYSPDHIPSYVPKTATDLLTNATFPYIQHLARHGKAAIVSHTALRQGVSCYQGQITHQYTATKKGFQYTNILDLL
jgi:alanine dehydrogenase